MVVVLLPTKGNDVKLPNPPPPPTQLVAAVLAAVAAAREWKNAALPLPPLPEARFDVNGVVDRLFVFDDTLRTGLGVFLLAVGEELFAEMPLLFSADDGAGIGS